MNRKTLYNRKGFTLAELLVVVAIIGILVAVSIPIFTGQLEKARVATNQANIRAAKAAASADYIQYEDGKYVGYVYDNQTGTLLSLNNKGGSYTLSPNYNCVLFNSETKSDSTNSNLAQGLFFRISSSYYKSSFSSDSVSKCVVVYISPNGIKTCPYYDDSTKTILADSCK